LEGSTDLQLKQRQFNEKRNRTRVKCGAGYAGKMCLNFGERHIVSCLSAVLRLSILPYFRKCFQGQFGLAQRSCNKTA